MWEGSLIEGLAQTAAILNSQHDQAPGRGLLVGLRKLSIRRRPAAGEVVHYRVELIRRLAPLVLVRGVATSPTGELFAEGELKFFVEPA